MSGTKYARTTAPLETNKMLQFRPVHSKYIYKSEHIRGPLQETASSDQAMFMTSDSDDRCHIKPLDQIVLIYLKMHFYTYAGTMLRERSLASVKNTLTGD